MARGCIPWRARGCLDSAIARFGRPRGDAHRDCPIAASPRSSRQMKSRIEPLVFRSRWACSPFLPLQQRSRATPLLRAQESCADLQNGCDSAREPTRHRARRGLRQNETSAVALTRCAGGGAPTAVRGLWRRDHGGQGQGCDVLLQGPVRKLHDHGIAPSLCETSFSDAKKKNCCERLDGGDRSTRWRSYTCGT